MSVNTYLNSTADLTAFAVNALNTETAWSVRRAPGVFSGSPADLAPDLNLPSALVFAGKTEFGDHPRRSTEICVLLCVDASAGDAENALDVMTDHAARLLDGQTLGDAVFRIHSWRNTAADSAIFARMVTFLAMDH